MTGQEINEAVARKLGWKPRVTKCSTFDGQHDAEVIRKRVSHMPDYCQDIAAAWEVVHGSQRFFELVRYEGEWRKHYWKARFSDEAEEYMAEADTAPMAICLAFLTLDKPLKSNPDAPGGQRGAV